MGSSAFLLLAALLAAEVPPPADESESAAGDAKETSGVAPVELIPRLELRQSFAQLQAGVSAHVTTTELDIRFLNRVLLRYQGPLRVLETPTGQISGFGDTTVEAIGLLASNQRFVAVVIAGAVLDTASQPQLGAGKQQLVFGAAAAYRPFRWWLPYLIVQEQVSVAGEDARPDVNFLTARLGNIFFGREFSWYKVDFDGVADFAGSAGRLFGTLEVGSLLIGKTGLFVRTSTQLLGTRQLDYSLEVGIRYLFRLDKGK
jgi:hypothetical protein